MSNTKNQTAEMYTDLSFEGIDKSDYPDFCDAYIVSGKKDGVEMSEQDLEELNENSGLVNELLMEKLY